MLAYRYTFVHSGDSTQLTYLRSRYYASNTGRFLTRDTWGGDANSPMSYNTWLYVAGNPINFTDPSGYFSCNNLPPEDREECNSAWWYINLYSRGRSWSAKDISDIHDGVTATASAFNRLMRHMGYHHKSDGEVFRRIFGTVGFYASSNNPKWYCERYVFEKPYGVMCYKDSNNHLSGPLIAHELGHVYDATIGNTFPDIQAPSTELSSLIASPQGFKYTDSNGVEHKLAWYETVRVGKEWVTQLNRENRYVGQTYVNSSRYMVVEEFADMFSNWVYGGFSGPAGVVRNTWMTNRIQTDMSHIFGVPPSPAPILDVCE